MPLEKDIATYLMTKTTVTDYVGTGDVVNVFPMALPPTRPFPSISYQLVSDVGLNSTHGPSGLARARLQIDCWSDSYGVAKDLANVVRGEFDGFRGTLGETVIRSMILINRGDHHDPKATMRDVVRGVRSDYEIWYEDGGTRTPGAEEPLS
jgi:hypothetical protein